MAPKLNYAKLLYGRKKLTPQTTTAGKPDPIGLLIQIPPRELNEAVRSAVSQQTLDRNSFTGLLSKTRRFHGFDRVEQVTRAYQSAGKRLNEYHITNIMAAAVEEGKWQKAVEYYGVALNSRCATSVVQTELLVAYRSAGQWQNVLAHFTAMVQDRVVPSAHATHIAVNAARRQAPWQLAFKAFSAAVAAETIPSSAVYLELLRSFQRSHDPLRWQYATQILQGLEKHIELTAGMYNMVFRCLAIGGRGRGRGEEEANWQYALLLYNDMIRTNTVPNSSTLEIVADVRRRDTAHVVRCLAESSRLAIPASPLLYRLVLASLFAAGLFQDAVKLVEQEIRRSVADSGNPSNSLETLSTALVDFSLGCPYPRHALELIEVFGSRINVVIRSLTKGLGELGESTERWIVQGRVAVVDERVVLSSLFETLVHHYDHILIPFSCIRALVRMQEARPDEQAFVVKSPAALHVVRYVLSTLSSQMATRDGSTSFSIVRVLPLWHQVKAHTYLQNSAIAVAAPEKENVPLLGGTDEQRARLMQLLCRDELDELQNKSLSGETRPAAASTDRSSVSKDVDFVGLISHERSIFAAGMILKLFNQSDASVHIVSGSKSLLEGVRRWNKSGKGPRLMDVHFPTELSVKAPSPAQQQNTVTASGEVRAAHKDAREVESLAAAFDSVALDTLLL